ncbi:MAG: DNA-processing protein DprA [Bryobacteraceae bacterium]
MLPAAQHPHGTETDLCWLALRLIPGLGARKAVPLVKAFRSPVEVFRASAADLIDAGLSGSVAHTIASGCTFDDAADQYRLMRQHDAEMIPVNDPRYPARLLEIYDPPLLLFTRGRVELLNRTAIGVVGTRRPTPYGVAAAERLSSELAGAGMVIASGMARGIDTAAHRAALDANGATVAVFGSGVDHIYPAENKRLAERISTHGLLVSEFPMGNPGHPQNFPVRNRIISGISVGVLVVEGAQYSGSAITAQLAMEQNRDVFAVPGNITSKMSWAPNLLIKQGAKLVQTAEDVLTELSADLRRDLSQYSPALADASSAEPPLSPLTRRVLAAVPVEEAVSVDQLLDRLPDSTPSELLATLFEMQLQGLVRQMPGRAYVRVWNG